MSIDLERFGSLLSGAAPAVLVTRRKDGRPKVSPVWFRLHDDHFEVVIADDDIKLKHIERDPEVTLVVFEADPPFRGIQVTAPAVASRENLNETRRAITSRYLSDEASQAFTKKREGNGAVVRIPAAQARTWDLSAIAT
jgi:PPOX class probable F420-dependent enzyme